MHFLKIQFIQYKIYPQYRWPVLCCVIGRVCEGNTTGRIGYFRSPNYPGDYPSNVDCVWKISAEKGRRILIIIPELELAAAPAAPAASAAAAAAAGPTADRRDAAAQLCRDSLVMRKSG